MKQCEACDLSSPEYKRLGFAYVNVYARANSFRVSFLVENVNNVWTILYLLRSCFTSFVSFFHHRLPDEDLIFPRRIRKKQRAQPPREASSSFLHCGTGRILSDERKKGELFYSLSGSAEDSPTVGFGVSCRLRC